MRQATRGRPVPEDGFRPIKRLAVPMTSSAIFTIRWRVPRPETGETKHSVTPLQPSASTQTVVGPSWIEFEHGECAEDPGYDTGNIRIDQWQCVNQTNEWWYMEGADSTTWYVVNGYSGKCMNVASASTSNGAFVIQYPCSYDANNRWAWQYVSFSSGHQGYRLVNVNSGLCLNVAGYSTSNGADLIQYTCGDYLNELFYWHVN